MTDVFIRTTETSEKPLRAAMRQLCYERLKLEPDVRIEFIWNMSPRDGRMYAEEHAQSDPYILNDDDVLLVGQDWVKRAVSAILAHPEYKAVSSLSLVEGENQATGTGVIYEMHAVGAPMIIRKGTFKFTEGPTLWDPADLQPIVPEMDLNSECGVLHKYILDGGGKEGLVNGLRHNHLGHGFSSNPALHWGY